MSKEQDKKNVYNQMAWILNYQPSIKEQHIHMGEKSAEVQQESNAEDEKQEDDSPAEELHNPKDKLNFFAPKKNLQELLKGAWFAEMRTEGKYDATWTDAFVTELMKSKYGVQIAQDWNAKGERNKCTQIKGYVIGLLKDAGVLNGGYDTIAAKVKLIDNTRTFGRYMGEGKEQPYAEWVKEYVAK